MCLSRDNKCEMLDGFLSLKEFDSRKMNNELSLTSLNFSSAAKTLGQVSGALFQIFDLYHNKVSRVNIHSQKFGLTALFVNKIGQIVSGNFDLQINDQFARAIITFSRELQQLIDMGIRYSGDNWMQILQNESLSQAFNMFLNVWESGSNLIHYISLTEFLDIVELVRAHCADLNSLGQYFQNPMFAARSAELKLLQYSTDFLNVQIRSFFGATMHSSIYRASYQNKEMMVEVFKGESTFIQNVPKAMEHLDHPSIMKLQLANTVQPYSLVMEYFSDTTLYQYIHSENEIDPTSGSMMLLDLARGMEYLHAQRFVHRSLSPHSIFVDSNKKVKISGFWCISPLSQQMSGVVPISPYIAPEMMMSPGVYNETVDVYAFAIILWEILTRKIPYDGLKDYNIENSVLREDYRPPLPRNLPPAFADFIIMAWSRNPTCRPSFAQIVQKMENGELVLPNTNEEVFKSYASSTQNNHRAALKGILSMKPQDIQNMAANRPLDDYHLEVLTTVLLDSEDPQIKSATTNILKSELNRQEPFTKFGLITYVRIMNVLGVEEKVKTLFDKYDNREEILLTLFERIPADLAIDFVLKLGLKSEQDAQILLDFASKKSQDLAVRSAKAVIQTFPTSSILMFNFSKNDAYGSLSLDQMMGLSDAELYQKRHFIKEHVSTSKNTGLDKVNHLVLRLSASCAISDFDERCIVLSTLALNGFPKTVLRFTNTPENLRLLVLFFIPQIIHVNSCDALRILLRVQNYTQELIDQLLQLPIWDAIIGAIQAGDSDLASNSALRIPMPKNYLESKANEVIPRLSAILRQCENEQLASCILLCVLPFALNTKVNDTTVIPENVSKMMQSSEALVASRALTLAVALVQYPEHGRLLAQPLNIAAVSRFFDVAPPPFFYISVRFLAGVIPFISNYDAIQEAVIKMIDLLYSPDSDERLITVILQTLMIVPKNDEFHSTANQTNLVGKLIAVQNSFPQSPEVIKYVSLLKQAA